MNDTRARLGALRRQSGTSTGEDVAAGNRDAIEALREGKAIGMFEQVNVDMLGVAVHASATGSWLPDSAVS